MSLRTTIAVIASLVTGVLINEVSEVAPWLARRVVTRAARLWAGPDAGLARDYQEEWTRVVEDAPGKLIKLFHALCFYVGAWGHRIRAAAPRLADAASRFSPRWPGLRTVVSTAAGAVSLGLVSFAGAAYLFLVMANALFEPGMFWIVSGAALISLLVAGAACLPGYGQARRVPRLRSVFAVVAGAAAAFFGDLLVLLIMVNGDVVRPVFALAGLPWFVTGTLAARNGLAPRYAAPIGLPPRRLRQRRR